MAGTAMAVPLMNDSVEQRAATEAYKKFEAQQQAQRAWLADFDRDSGRGVPTAPPPAGKITERGTAPDEAAPTPAWRRALGLLCVLGIPVFSTASAEFGQYMETRLKGGAYRHGYVVAWANHSILVIFLLPWALIVMAEKGCSCSALWRAMVGPYGTTKRFLSVTFWLAFQYQLFNCELSVCRLSHLAHSVHDGSPAFIYLYASR
jgi:hypothetical protein